MNPRWSPTLKIGIQLSNYHTIMRILTQDRWKLVLGLRWSKGNEGYVFNPIFIQTYPVSTVSPFSTKFVPIITVQVFCEPRRLTSKYFPWRVQYSINTLWLIFLALVFLKPGFKAVTQSLNWKFKVQNATLRWTFYHKKHGHQHRVWS